MSNIDKQALRMRNYLNTAVISGVKLLHLTTDELSGLLNELEASEHTAAVDHEAACSLVEENEEVKRKLAASEKRIAELGAMREVFLRAKALMYQSGGAPIENSLNPIDAWLYDAERATAGIGIHSLHPNTVPPAPVVPDEIRNKLKAEGLADLLRDARDYAPLTSEQWDTLTNNWHQTFVGLSGENDSCRAAMLQGSQPVSNRDELPEEKGASLQLRNLIRQRHAEWSDKTFGNVGPVGPLKHLSKEALEAVAEPDDLSEWADMQFLLWDAQRRAGISDGEITAAMEEKLKVNMARQWPEPKDGEPRLHIKEQSESVLPEIECDICGHVSTDPEGRHHCCEDNSND